MALTVIDTRLSLGRLVAFELINSISEMISKLIKAKELGVQSKVVNNTEPKMKTRK